MNFNNWFTEDSNKSIEGTFCGVLAQLLVLPLLIAFGKQACVEQLRVFTFLNFSAGFFKASPIKIATFVGACLANGLIEAKTDQIDNLVLPLVTYIVLTIGC